MKRAQDEKRMTNMSCKCVSVRCTGIARGMSVYRDKAGDACPKGIVGQLSPTSLMHDGALVDATTDDIYKNGDHDDDAKDTSRAELLFCNLDTTAGSW